MINSFRLKAFVACQDIQRARDFYVDTLGCGLIERTPYAVVMNAGGTELRITLVDNFEPHSFAVLGFEVGDVVAEVEALRAQGVEFLDPDGNTLTLQRTIS